MVIQGDLARDLYIYQRTQLGELPYRDYFYHYGPLMPFYYAVFYALFGLKFVSLIWGVILLQMISGIAIYLILVRLATPLMALLGASWFWIYYDKIFMNFNHIGAVPFFLFNVYFLIQFYDSPKVSTFIGILITIFFLLLIKINVGLAVLASSLIVILIMRIKGGLKVFPSIYQPEMLFFVPIMLAALIYFFLLHDLPLYYVKQCLPLSSDYLQFKPRFFLKTLYEIILWHWAGIPALRQWAAKVLMVSLIFFILMLIIKRKIPRNIFTPFIILLISLSFLAHEFILLGVDYQLWLPYPVFICLFFLMASIVLRENRYLRLLWLLVIECTMAVFVMGGYAFKHKLVESQALLLPFDKIKIYSFNSPTWVNVVKGTADYLKTHLKPNEKFLAVPYEPLYYWLLDRKSPVIETMFFNFIHISPEQEQRVIANLEKEKVRYIVMSNRVHSSEQGLGLFGVTNCPLLADYIQKNFNQVISFGDWDNSARWDEDYAIKIYLRTGYTTN